MSSMPSALVSIANAGNTIRWLATGPRSANWPVPVSSRRCMAWNAKPVGNGFGGESWHQQVPRRPSASKSAVTTSDKNTKPAPAAGHTGPPAVKAPLPSLRQIPAGPRIRSTSPSPSQSTGANSETSFSVVVANVPSPNQTAVSSTKSRWPSPSTSTKPTASELGHCWGVGSSTVLRMVNTPAAFSICTSPEGARSARSRSRSPSRSPARQTTPGFATVCVIGVSTPPWLRNRVTTAVVPPSVTPSRS